MNYEPHPGKVYHFPQLHKGDCFYDILSRFHLQSAHLTFRATSMELFGTTPDLVPSITLPYRAELLHTWLGTGAAITPDVIRDHHSAWPYLQLSSEFTEEELIPIISAVPRPGRRKQRKMVYALQNEISHLRYCPLCLVRDFLRENEPFWHQVHQLYGVKYCPIHEIQLLEVEDVFIRSRLGRYVTAGILHISIEEQLARASVLEGRTDPHRSAYLALSKAIAWLLEHGLKLGKGESLQRIYNHRLGIDEEYPLKGALLQRLLLNVGGIDFLRVLYPGEKHEAVLDKANRGLNEFSPLEHALIVTALGYPNLDNLL